MRGADGRLRLDANAFQSRASNVPLGIGRFLADGSMMPLLPGGIRTRGFDASVTLASVGSLTWDWNTTLRAGRTRGTFVAQDGGLSEGAFLSSQWGRLVTFRDGLSVTALARGDASPTFVFAQSNDVARRRWRLTTQIDGEVGGRITNLSQAARDDLRISTAADGGAARAAEADDGALVYLQSASWVRLREVTLSHDLNYQGWWLLPPNTRFELGARDLVTWSRLDAYDPAARLPVPPGVRTSSQSFGRFPMLRTIEVRIVLPN